MRYQTAAPLNKFIDKCESMSKMSFAGISFPVLLLSSNDVFLLNEAIEEFSQNVMKRNIISSCGSIPLINVKFDCCDDFTAEFQRLIKMMNLYSGFSNNYHGIVAIDISGWGNNAGSDEFDALMAYLSDTSKDRIYVFYTLESEEILRHALSRYFVVQKTQISLEKPSQMVNYILTKLSDKGFETQGISSSLKEVLDDMFSSGQYQGVETLEMLHREISHYAFEKKQHSIDDSIMHDFVKQFKFNKRKDEKAIGLIK